MARRGSLRRYPRVVRVNEVVRETIADELERLSDPRLGFVTVTGVEVTPDLRAATVYYSALDPAASARASAGGDLAGDAERRRATRAALQSAAPHLRAQLGRQVRLKYVPALRFREDPAIERGQRIEAIIREIHERDEAGPDA